MLYGRNLFLFLISIVVAVVAGCVGPGPTSMPASPTDLLPRISKEQATAIATEMLPDRLDSVVARSEIRAELHGWYWEVIFDNINATYDELTPFPLRQPPTALPLGQPTKVPEVHQEIYHSMVITIDAETGNLLGATALKAPRPGPYVSQEKAVNNARLRVGGLSDKARTEAYLRGDTWFVLFYEINGSSFPLPNRIQVIVDAVTGEATGAARF